jgi:hypothetical protein
MECSVSGQNQFSPIIFFKRSSIRIINSAWVANLDQNLNDVSKFKPGGQLENFHAKNTLNGYFNNPTDFHKPIE